VYSISAGSSVGTGAFFCLGSILSPGSQISNPKIGFTKRRKLFAARRRVLVESAADEVFRFGSQPGKATASLSASGVSCAFAIEICKNL
jgi:hypothetical protein